MIKLLTLHRYPNMESASRGIPLKVSHPQGIIDGFTFTFPLMNDSIYIIVRRWSYS